MKHPGDKIGNNVWCNLTTEAIAFIKAQPKTGERIFPYSTESISAAFTRACKTLGIKGLHFHDLRHEGASWLFEKGGLDIPQVSLITGHRGWSSLQRYSHIRQTGDKYENWKWKTP
jgi:integrase